MTSQSAIYNLSKLICLHASEWDTANNMADFKDEVLAIYQKGIDQEEVAEEKQAMTEARDAKIVLLEDKIKNLCFWDQITSGDIIAMPQRREAYIDSKYNPKKRIFPKGTSAEEILLGNEFDELEKERIPRQFPSDSNNIYHLHPIAFVEHMKLICGNEGVIEITRKWEHWTGSNYNSTTISSFEVGGTKIKGYIAEPYGAETIKSGKDKRIPVGTYNLTWHTSDNFPKNKYVKKGRPILENGFPKLYNDKVSEDRGILIHVGNDGEDSEGCLLPGKGLKKKDEKVVGIKSSTDMFYELISYIEKNGINNVKVMIKDEI